MGPWLQGLKKRKEVINWQKLEVDIHFWTGLQHFGEKSAKPANGDWMRNQEYWQFKRCITALLRESSVKILGNSKCWMRISTDKGFLFSVVRQRWLLTVYQRFGVDYRSYILQMGPNGSPKTSVNNYQHPLRNNPERRRPHLHRSGSMNFRTVETNGTLLAGHSHLNRPLLTLVTDETSHLR